MPRSASIPLISALDLFKSETNPSTNVGSLVYTQDGRKFRYVLNGGVALVTGNLIQAKPVDTQFNTMAVQANTAIGATAIPVTIGTTTVAANDFNGGILVVDTSTGIGQYSRIVSHNTGTSGQTVTFNIEDPLQVAITSAGSKISIKGNPWALVVQAAGPVTAAAVGGAVNLLPLSVYGFVQTGGMGAVLGDATATAAATMGLSPATGTAGAVTKLVSQDQVVGRSLNPVSISAKVEPCIWQID